MKVVGRRQLGCLALALALCTGVARGQEPGEPASEPVPMEPAVDQPAPPTIEQLGEQLQAIKVDGTLDDAAKAELSAVYDEAIALLKTADSHARRAADFERRRSATPQQITTAREKLEQPETPLDSGIPADAALAAWQQRLGTLETELSDAKAQLAGLQSEPQRRADRRSEITQDASALRQQVADLVVEDNDADADGATQAMLAARDARRRTRRLALEQELRADEAELACYDATAELLPLERDLAARRVAQLDKLVAHVRQQVNERRAADARAQEEAARASAAHAHPAVKALAEENHRLTVQRQEMAAQIERAQADLDQIGRQLEGVRSESQRTQARVKAAGLSNAVGSLLRRQWARLPDVDENVRQRRRRQAALADRQLQWYELDDQRSSLADLDERADEILGTFVGNLMGAPEWLLRDTVRDALKARREVLDAILGDCESLHRLLVDLDTRQRELIDETVELAAYIDERVLWIHSLPTIASADVASAATAARELASPANWWGVVATLWADIQHQPGHLVLGVFVLSVPLVLHGQLRRRLRQHGERAVVSYCESFSPTSRALALTIILAAAGPAVVLWIAWRLTAPWSADGFSGAVAAGLHAAGLNYLFCECVLKICRPWGLAEAHFGWPRAELSVLRRNVRWLALVVAPASFLVVFFEARSTEAGMSIAGRMALVVALAALAVFLARVLNPSRGIVRGLLATSHGRWYDRLRWLWFPLAVGVPGSLALLAAGGYYYTALRLTERLQVTMWLLLGVVLASGLLWRWLLLARRSLAIKQARARRAALQAELTDGAVAADDPLEISQVDLSTINAQSQQLLRAAMAVATMCGLWAVWVDVLPALSMLNGIELWARGTEHPISLAHLLVAMLFVAMTAVAYRNIPGLLEITLLQRLPLDAGARYAVTSVSRYLIALIGIVSTFEEIGVGWSKVQWLLAAMSVGLGFGLQEIFANFVSGLIILFERPVRLGDVVTVGDVTGSVSRIRMRATTITDGDRKELVVPNKLFITDRLVNWTLTDTVTRLSIAISVPHGADVAKTERVLLDAARAHALVLADPGPSATFERFGSAAVEFILRVFVASTDQLGTVRHDLNKSIERRLREQGIEVSPPREVFLRTLEVPAAAARAGRTEAA